MKSNVWKVLILLGCLMILAAALLCVYNIREGKNAGAAAADTLSALRQEIPEPAGTTAVTETVPTGEDLFALYETTTAASETAPPDIVINSDAYCGYLEIPVLGLELPVQSGWSYPALKKSPCCYSGSALTNDFIICAHNYPSHFGRLGSLTTDDRILFTDTAGTVHTYAVSGTEIIDGGAVTQMFSGQSEDWDLTLYTCTLGGQSRVTVRAYRVTDDADTPD